MWSIDQFYVVVDNPGNLIFKIVERADIIIWEKKEVVKDVFYCYYKHGRTRINTLINTEKLWAIPCIFV
jgi:hypothetical protein